jgi:hypothetical protein
MLYISDFPPNGEWRQIGGGILLSPLASCQRAACARFVRFNWIISVHKTFACYWIKTISKRQLSEQMVHIVRYSTHNGFSSLSPARAGINHDG